MMASSGGDVHVRVQARVQGTASHSVPDPSPPPRGGLAHPSAHNYQMEGGTLPAIVPSALLLTLFCITWAPLPLASRGAWRLQATLPLGGRGQEAGRERSRRFFPWASQPGSLSP